MMYYCEKCGSFFREPHTEYEDPSPSGISLPAGAYRYDTCPECGSDAIDEAHECVICGSYIPSTKEFCEDCDEKIYDAIRELVEFFGGDYMDTKEKVLDRIAEMFF